MRFKAILIKFVLIIVPIYLKYHRTRAEKENKSSQEGQRHREGESVRERETDGQIGQTRQIWTDERETESEREIE